MKIAIALAKLEQELHEFATNLIKALLDNGHQVQIYTHEQSQDLAYLANLAIKPVIIEVKAFNYGEQKVLARVRQELKDKEIDLMFSLQINTHPFWALACLGTGIPFIYSECFEFIANEAKEQEARKEQELRSDLLACADMIHKFTADSLSQIPELYQDKVRIMPRLEANSLQNNFALYEQLFSEVVKLKNQTTMDSFTAEPFLSTARLVSVAKREYLGREFGDNMTYSPSWYWQRTKNFFSNIKRPLSANIRKLKQSVLANPELRDFVCIVRSVGERTTNACLALLEATFKGQVAINLIENVEPFNEALRQTLQIGIKSQKKWALVMDADVLVSPELLLNYLNLVKLVDRKAFMIQANIWDKFFLQSRLAGNRLYQIDLMAKALPLIPENRESLRPETSLCQNMQNKGYKLYNSNALIGLHDYEQNYLDILRKAILFGLKHGPYLNHLQNIWQKRIDDLDYAVALDGIKCTGLNYTKNQTMPVIVDKNLLALCSQEKIVYWQGQEKTAMQDLTVKDLNDLLQREFFNNGYFLPQKIDLEEIVL